MDPTSSPAAIGTLAFAHAFAGDAEGIRDAILAYRERVPESLDGDRLLGHAERMLGNQEEAFRYLRLAELCSCHLYWA